jgi:transposase InsO family protein
VRFTDTGKHFIAQASVYRILKAHDLIAGPAFVVITAADEFTENSTAPDQLWQTDFTYLKLIGWGWLYLSTTLDDYSRYIVAWKRCTTMKAGNAGTHPRGVDQTTARVMHKPRLLSDNGSS